MFRFFFLADDRLMVSFFWLCHEKPSFTETDEKLMIIPRDQCSLKQAKQHVQPIISIIQSSNLVVHHVAHFTYVLHMLHIRVLFFVNITQNSRFVACSMEIPSKILSNFPPFLQLHPGHRSHGSSAVAESHPRSCWGHFLSRHHGFQKADPMTWMKTGTHLIRKLPGSTFVVTSWLVHVPKKKK